MGAARLRISAFPVIGEGADAHIWDVITSYSIHYTKLYEESDLKNAVADDNATFFGATVSVAF